MLISHQYNMLFSRFRKDRAFFLEKSAIQIWKFTQYSTNICVPPFSIACFNSWGGTYIWGNSWNISCAPYNVYIENYSWTSSKRHPCLGTESLYDRVYTITLRLASVKKFTTFLKRRSNKSWCELQLPLVFDHQLSSTFMHSLQLSTLSWFKFWWEFYMRVWLRAR